MSISTLGEAVDAGWRAFAACPCGVRDELQQATLLWRSGRTMPLDVLPTRLRCPVCGGRDARVTWNVPSSPAPKTLEEAMATPGRYLIEQLDLRGRVVETIKRDKFAAGLQCFRERVASAPGCRFIMRDGSRVVRQWPERRS